MNASDLSPTTALFIAVECACWLAGALLLWRLLTGRMGPDRCSLAPWPVSLNGFVVIVLATIAGGMVMPQAVAYLDNDILGPAATDGDWWMLVQGAAFQGGMLAGAALGAVIVRMFYTVPPAVAETPPARAPAVGRPFLAGCGTFLVSLPLIGGIGYGWKFILDQFGIPSGEQDMVDLFRTADDPLLLLFMIILAVVVAPVTEELIFRAGLFRYLRTRLPRPVALVVPALVFAVLHGNLAAFAPLFALGVFFALAYERTGRIAVPMTAHALFNLNTILMIMAGVSD